ncbi:putative Ig domain-containing protein [Desmonostoc muscorum LEGE 12446]|uniref:Putative Ig domain-containing protein n=1 Tax=Desmonostoc muscorum LEGE 12446 TaxID=1828758 RepID=A0A8J7D2Z9_DESMC|nr:putative Ig domain-containing protein [Desmonostoc muscorum]MCF2148698.1 putative Ig domain-containing protein [Desmonostoc muscorum LEGE 12446]
MPKIVINEFYRGGTLTTTDEFIELLVVEDLTAIQLESFFVGDSTSAKASKFSAYKFTNVSSIASTFKAGTIITIGGNTAITQDTSYNPSAGDWNIAFNAGGSFLPNANSGNNGDIAADDVVWVDTSNTGSTISTDGFAVDIGTATGAFTSAANVNFGTSTNNTGYALNSDLVGATNTTNWTTGIAFTTTTPGLPNGGANTTYINSLRSIPATPTLSLSITPSSFAENAGANAATATLTRSDTSVPDLVVNLSSNDPTEATLPTTVTFTGNSPTVTFAINAEDDLILDGSQSVTITASATGFTNAIADITVTDNEVAPSIKISEIQGAGHISPLRNQTVNNVAGIVTVKTSNGFYLQDPNPDNNDRTSEAIFVFTSSAPTVSVGDSVLVTGTVTEFRPGNNANNLTTTEITSPTIVKLSSGNTLPTATILGNGGRTIPTTVIDNDTSGNIETGTTTFDPAQDGIDFYESLEGMLVQVNNPVAVSPTNSFGEIWILADNGANVTGRTARGGIAISANDFNPERIQIDDTLFTSGNSPQVNVGATFDTITGVVDYNFNNYEVLPTSVTVTSNTLTREVTALTPTTNQLTVATFNVENLDPGDGATKFNNLANRIVNNLRSPDIISLEEIQDNNGATNNGVVDASTTFQTLINAIAAAGGPTYEYRQIDPVNNTNGGEPGGNIRVGFLFNPNRVSFVDRPGGTSTSNTTVTNNSGVPTVSNSPGLIDPTNSAFNSSRKPLVGEFTFNGETVYVIGNHFNSKGGDQPLYGPNQPPTLTSEVQRQQQATLVKNFVESILAIDPNANVVVAGDLNDFEFSNPLSTLESAGLTSLIETLPENERYTYNFEGNAQTLDHILISNNLLSKLDGYDVVHFNSEFADQDSDHDPSVARFNLPANNTPQVVQPIDDQIISTDKSFSFNISNKFADIDPGDTLTYSTTGLPNGASIVANTGVISGTVSTTGIFAVTVTAADAKGLTASDTFELTVANNKATSGNDIIFIDQLTGLNRYIIYAQAGSDRVIGTNASEFINGGAGNDYLDGKGGADILLGDDGNDTILGGLGSDLVSGGDGNDRLISWGGGTKEIDLLNGDQGADTYVLGDSTSVFYASSGNADYADILNLQASDRIQLKGVANNYSLGSASSVSINKSAVGIFTSNGAELIAVVENGLNQNTNLVTDTRFVFV